MGGRSHRCVGAGAEFLAVEVGGEVDYVPMSSVHGRIAATLALIYPPGIGIMVPGERYAAAAAPMIDYFLVFEEASNRCLGFSYEVQGVYQQGVIVTMVSNVRARIAAARARHRRHTRPLMTAWES